MAFVGIVGLLQLGPVLVEVLHLRPRFVRGWAMFFDTGLDVCDVRYSVRDGQGERAVSVAEVMRATRFSPGDREGSRTRIANAREAAHLGRDYCKTLPTGSAVHFSVRCPSLRTGWVVRNPGEVIRCDDQGAEPQAEPGDDEGRAAP